MMKGIGLLIIFSIFYLTLYPCLSLAEETGEPRVQDAQTDMQKEAESPSSPVQMQVMEASPAPDQTQEEETSPALGQTQETETSSAPGQINDEQPKTVESTPGDQSGEPPEEPEEYAQSNVNQAAIADPLEPVNRAFFVFNDKLYYWFYKPVASVYIVIAPEPVRIGIKNFFNNIFFPVRFVNSLLQAKFKGAGNEVGRFLINSTIGLAGFIDVADKKFGIKESDEDFGQTLAVYGVGQGFYIDWPFIGPSTTADTLGLGGDLVLDPAFYFLNLKNGVAEKSFKTFNNSSLSLEDYENMKKAALDPYVSIRDLYIQYRQNKIKQ
jgi:phospholipid-binding lipoprotein MlaA